MNEELQLRVAFWGPKVGPKIKIWIFWGLKMGPSILRDSHLRVRRLQPWPLISSLHCAHCAGASGAASSSDRA